LSIRIWYDIISDSDINIRFWYQYQNLISILDSDIKIRIWYDIRIWYQYQNLISILDSDINQILISIWDSRIKTYNRRLFNTAHLNILSWRHKIYMSILQIGNFYIYIFKVVISVCLSVWMSDHNSWTFWPICLTFLLETWWNHGNVLTLV